MLFFIRCLPAVHDARKPLYGLAAFICVEQSAFTIALFLQCRPINFYWDKTVEGTCFNQPHFYYADAAFNLATDIVILSLPWVLFRSMQNPQVALHVPQQLTRLAPELNVSKRRKYVVVAICSLGVFTLIATLLRFPYLHDLNQSTDPTWSVPNVVIWSIAELGSAITLSSIPAIRPLYAHVFQKHSKKNTSSSESGGTNVEIPEQRPRRVRRDNFSFGMGSLGSIVDKSMGRTGVRMSRIDSEETAKNVAVARVPASGGGAEDVEEAVDSGSVTAMSVTLLALLGHFPRLSLWCRNRRRRRLADWKSHPQEPGLSQASSMICHWEFP